MLAAKAGIKTNALICDATDEKYEKTGEFELTKIEKVKAILPSYIPTIAVGTATIACIFGSNILNKQAQASLASAYALLDRSYREYTRKVKDLCGEEVDAQVKQEMSKEIDIHEGEQLFYDLNSMQYFAASIDDVLQKTVMDDGLECYIISTPFDVMPRF